MEEAVAQADPRFVQALRNAMENIRAFHSRQKQQSFIDAQPNGVLMGQRIRGSRPFLLRFFPVIPLLYKCLYLANQFINLCFAQLHTGDIHNESCAHLTDFLCHHQTIFPQCRT